MPVHPCSGGTGVPGDIGGTLVPATGTGSVVVLLLWLSTSASLGPQGQRGLLWIESLAVRGGKW